MDRDFEQQEMDINLEELLGDMSPSIVTPHLAEISAANTRARPKILAQFIIRGMAKSLKDPVGKEIIHDGEIHAVHYVNVEPLCSGNWAVLSLMLLNLSFGEQCTIIEAVYPKHLQLTAKAFAVAFTPELKGGTVILRQDKSLLEGIEQANAGIAILMSLLKHVGTIPHADEINKNRQAMAKLVQSAKERENYHKGHSKSQQAAKHNDALHR